MGYAATACMLTAAAAGPANGQAPLGLDGRPSEQATTPVAQAIEPVSRATEQVATVVEPVSRATEQVATAAEPVTRAAGRVAAAAEPVSRVAGELAGAAKPVLDATGQVAGAAKPVLDAAAGVAAPAVQLGKAVAPVGDVVDGLTRPGRGGTGQPAGFGRLGSGRPPRGDAAGTGSKAGGLSGAGSQSTAPEMLLPGATIGPSPAAGHGALPGPAPDQRLTTATPDQPGTAVAQGRRANPLALITGLLSGPVPLPRLADVIAPPSAEASTSTSRGDRHHGRISPGPQPTPAPSAPAGAAAAGAASAGSAGPVLALLALLLLAAPSLSRFFRTVPEFLRPAPFIVALERPG